MRNYLFAIVVAGTTASFGARGDENPRHLDLGGLRYETLDQNWSNEESNWFYTVAQGSRLLPYNWFLHLEQSDSEERFRSNDNIRRFGYLPRLASAADGNPNGLPIGFVKDAPYEDGTEGLGLTCAACHTGLITYKNTAYLIDGGPNLGNLEELLKSLVAAMDATESDDAKFARFASQILDVEAREDAKRDLRRELKAMVKERADYNRRNLSSGSRSTPFGHGRVDAFGAILNEVSANSLEQPANVKTASAPVSYPCLWDTPQHDRVQWNGSAFNTVVTAESLGLPAATSRSVDEVIREVFGTSEIGALGRNTGEVLGVFGSVSISEKNSLASLRYASTANVQNLLDIEDSLKTLWSPKWPGAFPVIDAARKSRGRDVFVAHCHECHKDVVRDDEHRRIKAQMKACGTDSTLHKNFLRMGSTGRLDGRKILLLPPKPDRFAAEGSVASMLKHVIQRAILNPIPKDRLDKIAKTLADLGLGEAIDMNAFSTGYETTAMIDLGGKSVQVSVDQLTQRDDKIRAMVKGSDLSYVVQELGLPSHMLGSDGESSTASIEVPAENATAEAAYKARPLNGVWATAPYLHNGSVPTLHDLLQPREHADVERRRPQTFNVGSIEFDPVKVGFVNDSNYPIYDTSAPGNSNAGHEFGVELSDEEKLDLIEYLKSL